MILLYIIVSVVNNSITYNSKNNVFLNCNWDMLYIETIINNNTFVMT